MHVLAFVNQKGGCGKTTTAVHLAGALVQGGARALLVDLDPQGHATMALGRSAEGGATLRDVLEGRAHLADVIVPAAGGVDLVPADERLVEFEERAARLLQAESRLARALDSVADAFDYVVLDCPPRTEGVLAQNALRACDTAVLVVEAGAFALQGALRARTLLEERRDELRARGAEPFALRAVATLFDRRARIARDLLIGMHARFGPVLFDTAIRTSVRLREAAALGVTIQSLEPTSGAAQDFAALAREVVEHAATCAPRERAGADATRPSLSTGG